MKYSPDNLGEKIKIQRNHLGLSRESLAEILNISSSFLGLVERGERKFSIDNLCHTAESFNISVEYFLSDRLVNSFHDSESTYDSSIDVQQKKHIYEINELLVNCSTQELECIQEQIHAVRKLVGISKD